MQSAFKVWTKAKTSWILAKKMIRPKLALMMRGQTSGSFMAKQIFGTEVKPFNKMILKLHKYAELQDYFKRFANSRTINGFIFNQNAAFVIGAQNIGKSTYIKLCLEEFIHAKKSLLIKTPPPIKFGYFHNTELYEEDTQERFYANEHYIVLDFDFKLTPMLSFQGFVSLIHDQIIKQTTQLALQFPNRSMFDNRIIWKVVTHENAPEYIYNFMKDVIYCILNGTDPIYLPSEGVAQLEALNQSIHRLPYTQFIESGAYDTFVDILSQYLGVSHEEAVLRLYLSVGKRIQFQHRPIEDRDAWYFSGKQSTGILFDILNFLCGLGKFNKKAYDDMYKLTMTGKLPVLEKGNYIRQGNHIDVIMTMQNFQNLYCFESLQFLGWLDYVTARTLNRSNLRTHFPIMMEFPHRVRLDELQDMGQIDPCNPSMIEISGYYPHRMRESNFAEHFSLPALTKLFLKLGKNHYTWKKAVDALASGVTLDQIFLGEAEYILRDGIGFTAKMNRIFIDNTLTELLANGNLKYELCRYLRVFAKFSGLMLPKRLHYAKEQFTRPIFIALFRSKAFFESYYNNDVYMAEVTNLRAMMEYSNEILGERLLGYYAWRLMNFSVGTFKASEVENKLAANKEIQRLMQYPKQKRDFQFTSTYYTPLTGKKFRQAKTGWFRAFI